MVATGAQQCSSAYAFYCMPSLLLLVVVLPLLLCICDFVPWLFCFDAHVWRWKPSLKAHRTTQDAIALLLVIREVLVFVYNPVSLFLLHEFFYLPLSRCLMCSFDHNSVHIINLFSGRTICFFALPIYFQMHFFLVWFGWLRTKSVLISRYCIASIC